MHNENWLATPIARFIWANRYRRSSSEGTPDRDIGATWRRVARAAAAVEADRQSAWEDRFYRILEGFRFLPAGRILAGASTGRRVTLFNCFVMGLIEDDMEGIFEALKEGALTMQAGGGVGYDFSTLRPSGSTARATGRIASGPVPFLQVWDAMCGAVLATGARRGAMIGSLRCDHPDIEAFIAAKKQPGQLTRFNLSVQVSDAFMKAVADDAEWPLLFPEAALAPCSGNGSVERPWPGFARPVACRIIATRPARMLWAQIMDSCYSGGEPGVLFIDTINRLNNLAYRETITATNPCGEVPLPPYGACNLGSINLSRFVREPFSAGASLDLDAIRATVPVAVRLLDNVIDCSHFPLAAQAQEARGARRIGLGVTGLADALIMLGLHYGSDAGRNQASRAMQTICESAYHGSVELAREKGPFPYFEADGFLRSPFLDQLTPEIREGIARCGIRNSHLTAIAPTGTISLLAGNVSSGIEPVFDHTLNRSVLGASGETEQFELQDYACRLWRERGETGALPPAFVRAYDLAALEHLRMQAALQVHVDSAISKTINLPVDCSMDAFRDLYRLAHEMGLKGCTTFRAGAARGGVLAPAAEQSGTDCSPNLHCCTPERETD